MAASTPSSASSIRALIVELASPSKSVSNVELPRLYGLVEALKAAQRETIIEAVQACSHRPVLLEYCSDLTPGLVKTIQSSSSSQVSVRKTTRRSDEFLVQYLLTTYYESSGSLESVCYHADPVRLQYGKDMASLTAVAFDFGLLTQIPSTQNVIRVRHQVYDRAIGSELRHALSGKWLQQCAVGLRAADDEEASTQQLFEWHTHTSCCAHDAHNALKWSHYAAFGSTELLANVFAGVAGYKYCSGHTLDYLGSWLGEVVSGSDSNSIPSTTTLAALWTCLGATPEQITEAADEIGFFWDGHRLRVPHDFLQDPQWVNRLSTVLVSLWSFTSFSASRWLTTGASCRSMVRARMSGFMSFVTFMKEHGISSYYSAGCAKLGTEEWRFMCVVGLTSYLPEAVLSTIIVDGRVPLQADVCTEHEFMECVSSSVWDLLGHELGHEGHRLRSDVIGGMLVSWGFLWMRSFREASSLPWRLVDGNITENIQALKSLTTPPDDDVSFKIWTLSAAGYNQKLLEDAVRLLGQCSWTSVLAEKLHSGVAVVKRHHPDLQLNSLLARSYLHLVRQMLGGPTEQEQALARWQKQWQRLQRHCPEKLGGRHVFLRDIMERATATERRRLSGKKFDRRRIVQHHGQEWHALSDEQRRVYSHRASVERGVALSRKQEDMSAHLEAGAVLRAQWSADVNDSRPPNLLKTSWLRPETLLKAQDFMASSAFRAGRLHSRRSSVLNCPSPMANSTMTGLVSQSILAGRSESEGLPAWAKRVCKHRLALSSSILLCVAAGHEHSYRLLVAMQRPLSLVLLPLQGLVGGRHRSGSSKASWQLDAAQWNTTGWQYRAGTYVTGSVLEGFSVHDVFVYVQSDFAEPGHISSYHSPEPLGPVLDALDQEPAGQSQSQDTQAASPKKARLSGAPKETLQEFPWLQHVLSQASSASENTSSTAPSLSSVRPQSSPSTAPTHVDEQEYASLFEALDAKRREASAASVDLSEFRFALEGDARLLAKRGAAVHGVRVSVRKGSDMEQFVRQVSMGLSSRFEVSVYGQEGANVLSRVWARRMLFLKDLWDQKTESWPFTDSALGEFETPSEIEPYLSEWSGRQLKRARDVLAMRPAS